MDPTPMNDAERKPLSWGVIVCTLNREQFLLKCLEYALAQTRKPSEVVVVDASDYWEKNRALIEERFAEHWETIRLVYEPAKVRSITYQRSQALANSQADIIFSLDDDIYLHADAAEVVMEVYERDDNEEIAVIGARFVDELPGEEEDVASADGSSKSSPVHAVREFLERQLTLDSHFVPYGEPVDDEPPPSNLAGLNVYAERLVNGGRTTFRRKFGQKVGWSPLLLRYATHEDSDFSYRMSRFGRLLVAPDARFHHADGNPRKYDRFKVNKIRVYNLMALHRESSENRLRSSGRLMASFGRFAAMYMLIDPAQKRFTLPTVRAYALGAALTPAFMFFPFKDFRDWYLNKQKKMYNRG